MRVGQTGRLVGTCAGALAVLLCLGGEASAQQQDAGFSVPWWFIGLPILLGVVILYLAWLIRQQVGEARASRSWPTIAATVLSGQVTEKTNFDAETGSSTVYVPNLRYSYEVGGKSFEGHRLRLGEVEMSKKGALAVLARYPVGSRIEVHYDPAEPSSATIEAKGAGIGYLVFGVVALTLGLLYIVYRVYLTDFTRPHG
ncbi:MAG: DUF3592 domain-containing protein [Hyphomicrobiales bacterium]